MRGDSGHCCSSCGFGYTREHTCPSASVTQSRFTALKSPELCPFTPQPPETPDLSPVPIVLSFPGCHRVGITECKAFSGGFCHSVTCISGSSVSFHGSIGHFLSALNHVPLCGWTTVCPSPPEGHLVAFSFRQLLETSQCRFLCGHQFSAPLGKQQVAGLLG